MLASSNATTMDERTNGTMAALEDDQVDADDDPSDEPFLGFNIGFAILCIISFLCSIRAFHLGKTRSHYGNFVSARYLFPLVCLILSIENGTLASSRSLDIDQEGRLVQAVVALQALEVPILLVVSFELTYLVHKRRSVNFCGMYFDEGRRVNKINTTPVKSFLLRNFIRIVAALLFLMGIAANFDLLNEITTVDELAGKAGWWSLIKDPRPYDQKWHLLLSLLPAAVLAFCCFYFSYLLWRYGTESSIVVHSSLLNPWFTPFFGTLALAIGQVFSERWYPITSNIGMSMFVITLLLLMSEVDKDMVAADNFAVFLTEVAERGDKITVRRVFGEGGEEAKNNEDSMVDDGSFVVAVSKGEEGGSGFGGNTAGGIWGGSGSDSLEVDANGSIEMKTRPKARRDGSAGEDKFEGLTHI